MKKVQPQLQWRSQYIEDGRAIGFSQKTVVGVAGPRLSRHSVFAHSGIAYTLWSPKDHEQVLYIEVLQLELFCLNLIVILPWFFPLGILKYVTYLGFYRNP